jgi:hypothetical protein
MPRLGVSGLLWGLAAVGAASLVAKDITWREASPVPGVQPMMTWVSPAEEATLVSLAQGQQVLEIGSSFGYSTLAMASVAAQVTAVDPHYDGPSGRFTASGRWDRFMANIRDSGLGDRITVVRARSDEAEGSGALALYGLAFVDGDHRYESVLADAGIVQRHVRSGGVAAFHDYGRVTNPAVRQALDRWWGGPPPGLVGTIAIYPL